MPMTSHLDLPETPDEMLGSWPIGRVGSVRPAETGTNNFSFRVEAESGSYFLRIYRNRIDHVQRGYEHAVLLRLQEAGVSFAVPAPVVAGDGATTVAVAFDGRETIASLFHLIDGVHPRRGDVEQAEICGRALGELDAALGEIDKETLPTAPALFGDLSQVVAVVPDPAEMMAGLPAFEIVRARVAEIFKQLDEIVRGDFAHLPRQIIHGDFGGSNVLMDGERVSGVLDFEYVGEGMRAMELAVGLWAFGRAEDPGGDSWPPTEAFARGYRSRVSLTDAEIRALPELQRLREAFSLEHWVGRHRQGLTTVEDVVERVDRLLRLDERLRNDGPEMVRRLREQA